MFRRAAVASAVAAVAATILLVTSGPPDDDPQTGLLTGGEFADRWDEFIGRADRPDLVMGTDDVCSSATVDVPRGSLEAGNPVVLFEATCGKDDGIVATMTFRVTSEDNATQVAAISVLKEVFGDTGTSDAAHASYEEDGGTVVATPTSGPVRAAEAATEWLIALWIAAFVLAMVTIGGAAIAIVESRRSHFTVRRRLLLTVVGGIEFAYGMFLAGWAATRLNDEFEFADLVTLMVGLLSLGVTLRLNERRRSPSIVGA
jgi:hypothetical protein